MDKSSQIDWLAPIRWLFGVKKAKLPHKSVPIVVDSSACAFCGAPLKSLSVSRRTHRGHIASATKEWACGTRSVLEMLREREFVRGERCMFGHLSEEHPRPIPEKLSAEDFR